MKLNLNFNGFTKLKEWWKLLLENFTIIQNECNEMKNDVQNACTKKEAQAYIDRLVNLTPEYMQAINTLKEFIGETEDITDSLNEIYGERLKYYNPAAAVNADTIWDIEEDALYLIRYEENENVPTTSKGLLLNISGESGYQIWLDGGIYLRSGKNESWVDPNKEIKDNISDLQKNILSKSEVIFGVYTGDGTEDRVIDLGFEPVAVEIYPADGWQTDGDSNDWDNLVRGGLALKGYDCGKSHTAISVVENGFKITNINISTSQIVGSFTNATDVVYYFKAYKTGNIKVIE